jgi:hypothetical protein
LPATLKTAPSSRYWSRPCATSTCSSVGKKESEKGRRGAFGASCLPCFSRSFTRIRSNLFPCSWIV